jgi:hypothetical protein
MTSLSEELTEVLADNRREAERLLRRMVELAASGQSRLAQVPVPGASPTRDTKLSLIRPPDSLIEGATLAFAPYSSAEATRRLLQLAFRDAATCIDLTHAHGGCWRRPYPPGLTVTTSDVDPTSRADLHLDFTRTGLPDRSFDVAILDPPHVADAGAASIMGSRFGSAKGTTGLKRLIEAGVTEGWRLARLGLILKLTDHSHGGVFLQLTRWASDVLGVEPYCVLHTYRRALTDGKWKAQRVPRSNGATWMAFRRDGGGHLDFDALYERQVSRLAPPKAARHCVICDAPIGDRRADAQTCGDRCRQKVHRRKRD